MGESLGVPPQQAVRLGATGRIAAAVRRRRAMQAEVDPPAKVAMITLAADLAAAAGHGLIVCNLNLHNALQLEALLRLNGELLPGTVCRDALQTRLQACRPPSCCLVAFPDTRGALLPEPDSDPEPGQGPGPEAEPEPEPEPELAGFVLCECSRGEASVVLLAVAREFRRQGCARLMLVAALARAVDGGAKVGSLRVERKNAAAMALYDGLGFLLSGGDDRNDIVTLQRIFSEPLQSSGG